MAAAEASEYSYMLPQGARPAQSARTTIPARSRPQASHVSDIAMLPARRPGGSASGSLPGPPRPDGPRRRPRPRASAAIWASTWAEAARAAARACAATSAGDGPVPEGEPGSSDSGARVDPAPAGVALTPASSAGSASDRSRSTEVAVSPARVAAKDTAKEMKARAYIAIEA